MFFFNLMIILCVFLKICNYNCFKYAASNFCEDLIYQFAFCKILKKCHIYIRDDSKVTLREQVVRTRKSHLWFFVQYLQDCLAKSSRRRQLPIYLHNKDRAFRRMNDSNHGGKCVVKLCQLIAEDFLRKNDREDMW